MGGQGSVGKMVQSLKEIVNCSDSEIYAMLVECNMDPNETVIRLISQDTFQEVKSKRDKKKDTKDLAESSRRRIPNRGGGNKFMPMSKLVDGLGSETGLAQSVPENRRGNHWAGSSSASGVRPPPNSDPKNAEVQKAAPVYQSAWVKANPGKKTMAEILKMGKPKVIVPRSSKTQESGSKAPLKAEGSSTEKQDVSIPASSLWKPSAESQHVDESQMDDEVPKAKTNPIASHLDVDQIMRCSQLRFGSFRSEDTQETEEDPSFRHLDTNFYGDEEEEEQLSDNATDEQTSYQIVSNARNYHASSDSEREEAQHEPPQEDPQMQSLDNVFTNVMDLRDESRSPPGAGQQAAADPASNANYHQHGMPSGYYGNFTSCTLIQQGYMHSGFQPFSNHQPPLLVVPPHPSAASFLQQNENTTIWSQMQPPDLPVVPRGRVHTFHVHPNQQPPGFVLPQQLHHQPLFQQSTILLNQLHHHQHQHQHHHHHYHHHGQSAGEASLSSS